MTHSDKELLDAAIGGTELYMTSLCATKIAAHVCAVSEPYGVDATPIGLVSALAAALCWRDWEAGDRDICADTKVLSVWLASNEGKVRRALYFGNTELVEELAEVLASVIDCAGIEPVPCLLRGLEYVEGSDPKLHSCGETAVCLMYKVVEENGLEASELADSVVHQSVAALAAVAEVLCHKRWSTIGGFITDIPLLAKLERYHPIHLYSEDAIAQLVHHTLHSGEQTN